MMKKELIYELFQKFEEACYLFNNLECWSARELQEILGYSKWDNFRNIIEKAKLSGIIYERGVADFLPTLTIKAEDFATELTSHNVIEKDWAVTSK